MTLQNLKTAVRGLRKNGFFHLINVMGLGVSLSFIILIYLYVSEELSFDRFYKDHEHTFLIENTIPIGPSKGLKTSLLPVALAPALKEVLEVPITRYKPAKAVFLLNEEKHRESVSFVDRDFFSIFSLDFISGDAENALKERNNIVLSESIAKKYFGSQDPIGRIMMKRNDPFVVSAVIRDNVQNSSIETEILMNIENIVPEATNWTQGETLTFLFSKDTNDLTEKINKIVDSKTEFLKPQLMNAFPEFKGGHIYQLSTLLLKNVHFSTSSSLISNRGKAEYCYILIGIASLILIVACINYILLTLAAGTRRNREVAVRKALGATQFSIVRQFLTDSVLLTFIAGICGLVLSHLFISDFNTFISKNLVFNKETYIKVFFALVCIVLIVGLIAGSYPAFWLSRLKPEAIFKQKTSGKLGGVFSQLLSFTQFTICLFLIACSWIMFEQISFLRQRDLGVDAQQIVQVSTLGIEGIDNAQVLNRLKNELEGANGVEFVSAISDFPFYLQEQIEISPGQIIDVNSFLVDKDWNRVFGVPVVAGNDFRFRNETDSSDQVLINEALAMYLSDGRGVGSFIPNTRRRIIGVVKDFHYESFLNRIQPAYFRLNSNNNEIFIRLSRQADQQQAIQFIQKVWNHTVPGNKMVYSFLEDSYFKAYQETQNWQVIIMYATIYAIVISCMGVFAFSGFQASNAVKGIAVRRLFGAHDLSILWLLNRKIVMILLISFFVSVPLIYYFMSDWLNSFAYRIQWKWYWFLGTGMLGLIIVMLAVSYNVLRATRTDLVTAFKYE